MILPSLILGALAVIACIGCVLLLLKFYSLRRDLNRLSAGTRALVRNVPAGRVNFSSPTISSVWNSTLALASRSRHFQSARSAYDEMIQLGHSISSNVHQTDATARAAVHLLLRQGAPEVGAAAIFIREAGSGKVRLEHAAGIPVGRLDEALLSWIEKLLDSTPNGPEWGYHIPQRGGDADFSVFGFGYSFTAPLNDSGRTCGAIWLGFRPHALGLTPDKRRFIQGICDHCAASFYAASQVQMQIEEKDREKDFLLGLSHDLRAPGNSALYALRDLLADETVQLNVDQRLRLKIVQDCLEQQLDILGDVLDYTKHRRGILTANRSVCDLEALINSAIESNRLHAEQKRLTLAADPIPNIKLLVDIRHARRVLGNLIGNAIKYTERGTVHLSFSQTSAGVSVVVRDTGIGVPESERAKLFQEFSRLTNASHLPGVGLGLAVCRVLMELNGGSLSYRALPDGGSEFEALFVVGAAPEATQPEHHRDETLPPLDCVLVVDDDPAACRTIARCLHPLSKQVLAASNTADAMSLIDVKMPDLLITDYYLGESTAEDFLQKLHEREHYLPTIVLSGAADLQRNSKFNSQTAPIYFAEKPVDQAVLFEIIYRLLPERRANS